MVSIIFSKTCFNPILNRGGSRKDVVPHRLRIFKVGFSGKISLPIGISDISWKNEKIVEFFPYMANFCAELLLNYKLSFW